MKFRVNDVGVFERDGKEHYGVIKEIHEHFVIFQMDAGYSNCVNLHCGELVRESGFGKDIYFLYMKEVPNIDERNEVIDILNKRV